ncbi:7086_t:CDS:1, partial [Racocetra fulgida]
KTITPGKALHQESDDTRKTMTPEKTTALGKTTTSRKMMISGKEIRINTTRKIMTPEK